VGKRTVRLRANRFSARAPWRTLGGVLRSLLTTPGVPRVFAASLVARLPAATIELLLVLRVRELGGSYAAGGIAAGACALGFAAGAPVVGRAVDARGQTRILAICTAITVAALAALALVPAGTPLAVVVALAGVTGAAHPPLSACMRALWPRLVPDRGAQHAAYALEAAALELVFVIGPAVVAGVVAARSPALALALCALLLAGGSAAFAADRASRSWAPTADRPRDLAGALASRGLRTLLVVLVCLGVSFGAIEVSVVAFCGEHGSSSTAGLMLGAWGAASMVGGLVAARRGVGAQPVARLLALLGALAAADLLVALAPGPAALAVAMVVAGAPIAPLFALVYQLAGDVARAGTATEAFTWLTTGIGVGLACGTTLAGALAQHGGPHAGFAAAAIAIGLGALVVARVGAGALPAASGAHCA
jgi:predicted MFS family arabinose efflux permease